MSNRTDFLALAAELCQLYRLDPASEPEVSACHGQTLLWRLERELHNAYVAGQESEVP